MGRSRLQVANFYEMALFVKVDLTMIACRRSRLRQCPGGSGMAQGRLPSGWRWPRIALRSSQGCPIDRLSQDQRITSLRKVEPAKGIRTGGQADAMRAVEGGKTRCATTSVLTSARAPTGHACSTQKAR